MLLLTGRAYVGRAAMCVTDGQYFFCTYSPALANIMYAVIIINKHV